MRDAEIIVSIVSVREHDSFGGRAGEKLHNICGSCLQVNSSPFAMLWSRPDGWADARPAGQRAKQAAAARKQSVIRHVRRAEDMSATDG